MKRQQNITFGEMRYTVSPYPAGLPPWQVFEKILLSVVLLDLALGGNGYLIQIGGVRLRVILYVLCMGWAVLRLTRIQPIRLDVPLTWISILFAAVTAFGTARGYLAGHSLEAIAAELKPLGYFPMLFFFLVTIRTRDDLKLVVSILTGSGVLLASLYLLLLLIAKTGFVEYLTIVNFLHDSDEFIFRRVGDDQKTFIGFLYKGAFYIGVATIFLTFDPFKITKILAAVTVTAVAMTLTRSLSLALAACIVVGAVLSRDWRRAPLFVAQFALLIGISIFGARAEQALNDSYYGEHKITSSNNDQSMLRPTDSIRENDIKFIMREADISMTTIGRGLGAPIRDRDRIELTYFEIFYKQGLLGLSVWVLLFGYLLQLYLKVPAESKMLGLAFFLSGLFVYISTAGITFLTGSIGMAVVLISIAGLVVLVRKPSDDGKMRKPAPLRPGGAAKTGL
jgi:hypothetical protein